MRKNSRPVETYISSSHSREFGVGVIRRSDLHNISGHDMKTVESPEDGTKLACRPAAGLRRTSSGGKGRINRVDLNAIEPLVRKDCNTEVQLHTSIERYTGLSPTVSLIFLIMPSVPTMNHT